MPRHLVSMVLTGACAAIIGLMAGYSVGVNAPPLAVGSLFIAASLLAAGAAAFQTGVQSGARKRLSQPWADGQEALRQELDRSRRFERTFVLMRIPRTEQSDENGTARQPDAETLGMMLRSIDRTWSTKDATYVVLPESTRADARQLGGRLSGALPGLSGRSSSSTLSFRTTA